MLAPVRERYSHCASLRILFLLLYMMPNKLSRMNTLHLERISTHSSCLSSLTIISFKFNELGPFDLVKSPKSS
jgi:hypothetical protein